MGVIIMKKLLKRSTAFLLVMLMLSGMTTAFASEYTPHPQDRSFTRVPAAYPITELKYFFFAEYPTMFPLSDGVLGEGTFGTASTKW